MAERRGTRPVLASRVGGIQDQITHDRSAGCCWMTQELDLIQRLTG